MSPFCGLVIFSIVFLGFIGIIGICLIFDKAGNKTKGETTCPKCGHKFNYVEDDIIRFTFEGKPHKEVECPKCKRYITV